MMRRTLRSLVHAPCRSPDALHDWVRLFTGLRVPRRRVCPHHDAPFDYLCAAYFEPSEDLIVHAPRGGGKTRLAALATLLDLLHKPGTSVRILGGSLEQSLRMWEHLLPDLGRLDDAVAGARRPTGRRVRLASGSTAAVLTQSQRAVRGLRVQKLRCDEVELFDPRVWEAAQLVTRSRATDAPTQVRGTVEALSTHHRPFGLMQRLLDAARDTGRPRVIRWCLLEVLQRCPPERDCSTCPLWGDCGGVAKTACDGFVPIDDAIALKRRVSRECWDAEMLCRRPALSGCVFPSFDPDVHVRASSPAASADGRGPGPLCLAIDFGFANPFVCLWVRCAGHAADSAVHVVDEYVQAGQTLDVHLSQIQSKGYGTAEWVACDPAGSGRNDQTAASNVSLLRASGYRVRTRRSRVVDGIDLIRAALRPPTGPIPAPSSDRPILSQSCAPSLATGDVRATGGVHATGGDHAMGRDDATGRDHATGHRCPVPGSAGPSDAVSGLPPAIDSPPPPRLFVHPRCVRLIAALRGYRYPDDPPAEVPLKDGVHDHPIDALRYFFVNRAERRVEVRKY